MKPTPIWLLPQNFNSSMTEGQEAFLAGKPISDNLYGESLSGRDWVQGWKMARSLTIS